jgi:hypothetical protein
VIVSSPRVETRAECRSERSPAVRSDQYAGGLAALEKRHAMSGRKWTGHRAAQRCITPHSGRDTRAVARHPRTWTTPQRSDGRSSSRIVCSRRILPRATNTTRILATTAQHTEDDRNLLRSAARGLRCIFVVSPTPLPRSKWRRRGNRTCAQSNDPCGSVCRRKRGDKTRIAQPQRSLSGVLQDHHMMSAR